MDAQQLVEMIDKSESSEEPALAGDAEAISESRFEEIVVEALDGVGGTMLFKMTLDSGADTQHVAAGSVGEGASRRFLILSMPAMGGALRVEQASDSKYPIAGIAASYAGLADVLAAAA